MLKYEAYHFGENDLFSYFHNYNFNYTKHLHRSFEFVYVKKGNPLFNNLFIRYKLSVWLLIYNILRLKLLV